MFVVAHSFLSVQQLFLKKKFGLIGHFLIMTESIREKQNF